MRPTLLVFIASNSLEMVSRLHTRNWLGLSKPPAVISEGLISSPGRDGAAGEGIEFPNGGGTHLNYSEEQ
jgi:hypothetical protein